MHIIYPASQINISSGYLKTDLKKNVITEVEKTILKSQITNLISTHIYLYKYQWESQNLRQDIHFKYSK